MVRIWKTPYDFNRRPAQSMLPAFTLLSLRQPNLSGLEEPEEVLEEAADTAHESAESSPMDA